MKIFYRDYIPRAGRRLAGYYRRVRDPVEWWGVRALWGRSPWSRNRLGHRFQALSLSEYRYLRDGNPEAHISRFIERVLRPGMTVLDVGANHGLFSMEAAHHV